MNRLASAARLLVWFLPAIWVLSSGPREIDTCAVDPQGNVALGQPVNGFCEVPTEETIRWGVTLALIAVVILVVRHRRRHREAVGG